MNRRSFLSIAPLAALFSLFGNEPKPSNTIVSTKAKPFRVVDENGRVIMEVNPGVAGHEPIVWTDIPTPRRARFNAKIASTNAPVGGETSWIEG
jgi:hypothetical protein